ncbi:MAG: FtsX-like permease family protein [bacterium]
MSDLDKSTTGMSEGCGANMAAKPSASSPRLFDHLLTAGVFILIGLAVLAGFVLFGEPEERKPRVTTGIPYDEKPMDEALLRHGFEQRLQDIAAAGSRLTGSPGCERVEAMVSNVFRQAGLDVSVQTFDVTVPFTEVCEIRDASTGLLLEGVSMHPFMPAGMMPISCTFTAQLVATEAAEVRWLTGHNPREVVVVTTVDGGASWPELAAAGVPAMIVRDDPELDGMRSNPDQSAAWRSLVSGVESVFPCFYATGPIEKFAGRTVTVNCRVSWQERPARNVIGVLRGNKPRAEALVVSAYYDSMSVVPDVSPGAEQSVPLAAMLDIVEAIAPYRGKLFNDVVFVATAGHAQGMAGVARILEAVERFSSAGRTDYVTFEAKRAEHVKALAELDKDGKLIRTAAGEVHLVRREEFLKARLDYLRAGSPLFRDGFDSARATDDERRSPANVHPLQLAYKEARKKDLDAANRVSLKPEELLAQPEYNAAIQRIRGEAAEWHKKQIDRVDDLIRVRNLFGAYKQTFTLNLALNSGGSLCHSNVSLIVGYPGAGAEVEPQVSSMARLLTGRTPDVKALSWGARDTDGSPTKLSMDSADLESEAWFHCGFLSFSLCNAGFVPPKLSTPEDTLAAWNPDVLRKHVPAAGRLVLALAAGHVEFKPVPAGQFKAVGSLHGTIFAEAGSSTVVPTHPMGQRTVVRVVREDSSARGRTLFDTGGVCVYPVVTCSPYGTYERPIAFDVSTWMKLTVDAARFDDQWRIIFCNDFSLLSQSTYPSVGVDAASLLATAGRAAKPVHAGMFRCVPLAIYPVINPQSQQQFKGMSLMGRQGMSAPARSRIGPIVAFLEPDTMVYAAFMDGAADNPEILTARAFMLNVPADQAITNAAEPELWGLGYLAADTPLIAWPQFDTAASMLRTATKRLNLQQRFNMADRQALDFHARGTNLLNEAREKLEKLDPLDAINKASASLAYAISNHPVIRGRISQAVVGILWYLALLAPFVFFAEKLIFGFPDIRKQLVAMAILFLIVFGLLRAFHPAFAMVRSSLMILLGFVVLLLTLIVAMMIGGKFSQNIRELRRREGSVEGADVNRGGVIGTAFMLGLNNMRRRKVRTGLTCITLILITFVMICFTSISTDLVDVKYATGRSPWNGIMVRDQNYKNLEDTQLGAIRQIYGGSYPVATIRWLTPSMKADSSARLQSAEIQVDRQWKAGEQAIYRRATLSSAIEMSWMEPSLSRIDECLLTHRGWFPTPPLTPVDARAAARRGERVRSYVILPAPAANELGLTLEDVDNGGTNTVVTIRGETYEVLGIFDPDAMARIQGLDGRSLMPFDVNSVQQLGSRDNKFVAPEDIARLGPSQVMIVNRMPPSLSSEELATVYCSVLFPSQKYRVRPDWPEQPAVDFAEQSRLVSDYLERSGKAAFFAVDNVSYYGERRRSRSLTGLLQLIVPLLIAALTVFNTMRGSVYERREEIYVYNAVGIAPNHVFFMFMAEACVYAVVGAMCGYVLSQGTGRILTMLGLTGGLNLDYSSIETIYASLAIMAAVMLSTLLPARDAARLASPSGMTGWRLPPAENDRMEFDLPFTFTPYDRVAVLAYFHRWVEANGQGSSGPFYCLPPVVVLKESADDTPALRTTVWLKPYDLGVSQGVEISLPTDPHTKEFVAHIRLTLMSGHTAAWKRTVKPFLGSLRKQFLNWRATTPADRAEMFAEAARFLKERCMREDVHG